MIRTIRRAVSLTKDCVALAVIALHKERAGLFVICVF
jgi:hypothetical protein